MSAGIAQKISLTRLPFLREVALGVVLLLLLLGLSLGVPHFLSRDNLTTVLRHNSWLAILALGMTLTILTRGIDLSVGSLEALAGVVLGAVWVRTGSGVLALGAAFLTGAVCGAANGTLVARGKVPPLIVTLATLTIFRGLAYGVAGDTATGQFPLEVRAFGYDVAGIPAAFCVAAGLLVVLGVYLARTEGGRRIYALGLNPGAARLSGISVNSILFRVYLVNGLLSALAGVLWAARDDSVRANIGEGDELTAIMLVVMGGTSVAGGSGTVTGTGLAFLILIFLQNGMDLRGVSHAYQNVLVALLLIAALLLDAWSRRMSSRA